MKRTVTICLALLLSIFMTVSVYADAGSSQRPDYATDYYMVVESPDGGINIYPTASFEKAPLNSELIPNGTALHIQGELADGSRTWGYTEYRGMRGYVPLDDCRMVSKSEAIESELYAAGAENVNYNANYDVTAGAGNMQLYQGPGEKYGVVPGSSVIEKGTTLHITTEANLLDGSHWGLTTVDGLEGWVNLEQTEDWTEDSDQQEVVDMSPAVGTSTAAGTETVEGIGTETEVSTGEVVDMNGTETEVSTGEVVNMNGTETEVSTGEVVNMNDAEVEEGTAAGNAANDESEVAVVAEPTATSTPTPEPTATSTPTPDPTATSTPTPDPTATSTPTPDPTATSTPTPDPTATDAPDPTATDAPDPTATDAPDPTATDAPEETATPEPTEEAVEDAEETAGTEVEAEAEQINSSPLLWIVGISILVIIILLIYHLIKRRK